MLDFNAPASGNASGAAAKTAVTTAPKPVPQPAVVPQSAPVPLITRDVTIKNAARVSEILKKPGFLQTADDKLLLKSLPQNIRDLCGKTSALWDGDMFSLARSYFTANPVM